MCYRAILPSTFILLRTPKTEGIADLSFCRSRFAWFVLKTDTLIKKKIKSFTHCQTIFFAKFEYFRVFVELKSLFLLQLINLQNCLYIYTCQGRYNFPCHNYKYWACGEYNTALKHFGFHSCYWGIVHITCWSDKNKDAVPASCL